MANHLKGEVEIRALGRTLVFRLGVNEMLEAQNALGLADKDDAFLEVFDESRLRSLKTVRTIVLHGLKRNEPAPTEEQAGDIVTEVGLQKMAAFILEALRWALPEKSEDSGGESRPSPGRPSSPMPPEQGSPRTK